MESDCRLPRRGKLLSVKDFNFSLVFVILFSTSVNVCVGFFFDCDAVNAAKKCHCSRGSELGWETECPAAMALEQYPITLNVKPYKEIDEAELTVQCVRENNNFPWELIGGFDVAKASQGFRIAKLVISYCSPLPITDGFQGFFKQINISGSDVKELVFANYPTTPIPRLPQNFLNEMPNLKTLNLHNNILQTFPNLNSLDKLETLNLKYNHLVNIPRDAFANNKNLTYIELESNNLTKIEKATFPDKVVFIDLKDNDISTLTFESFANLKKLKVLYLNGNPLDNFEVNTFNDLTSLESLSLRNVDLNEFPSLSNLRNLKKLSVSRRRRIGGDLFYSEDRATTTYFPEGTEGALTTITPPEDIIFNIKIEHLPNLAQLELFNLGLVDFPELNDLPNLEQLNLQRNKLQIFPINYIAKQKFPNLTWLDLSRNNITELNPPGLNVLKELNLHDNKIKILNPIFFQQSSQLVKLTISRNQIESISDNIFESLEKLEEINLSDNKISFNAAKKYIVTASVLPDIGSNQSPFKYNIRLQRILLSKNMIDSIYDDWKYNLIDLNLLELRSNKFTELNSNDFSFIQRKIRVDFKDNAITRVNMDDAMIYLTGDEEPTRTDGQDISPRLVTIVLDSIPLDCDCQAYYLKRFRRNEYDFQLDNIKCQTPENMRNESLKSVSDYDFKCPIKDGCPDDCDCWQRSVDTTILIDCSNRNLSSSPRGLPQVSNDDIIRQLRSARSNWKLDLLLSGNGIGELNHAYVASLSSHLRMVDLSNNNLKSLSFLDFMENNNFTKFALAENPFPCDDCPRFQIKWRSFTSRLEDLDNITCILNTHDGKEFPYITSLDDDFKVLCPGTVFSTELRALVIVATLLLAVLVLVVAVYIRHGWAIRAFLYSKGLGCCLCCDSLDDDENKTYDAFVSYSHKDEEWVLNELVNRLEERDGFKLCVHIRDWIPGAFITDQIVRSVDQSRRTVIILSKHFVESIWSRLEFKTAHSQAINDKTNRLILILMGDDLTDNDIQDEDLRLYMKMNTYLKWNDPWFWHKLKYALPHRKNNLEENRNVLQKREQRDRAIQLDKLRAKLEQNV